METLVAFIIFSIVMVTVLVAVPMDKDFKKQTDTNVIAYSLGVAFGAITMFSVYTLILQLAEISEKLGL